MVNDGVMNMFLVPCVNWRSEECRSVVTGFVKYDHVTFIAGAFQRLRAEQNGIDTAVWVSHHVHTKEEEIN